LGRSVFGAINSDRFTEGRCDALGGSLGDIPLGRRLSCREAYCPAWAYRSPVSSDGGRLLQVPSSRQEPPSSSESRAGNSCAAASGDRKLSRTIGRNRARRAPRGPALRYSSILARTPLPISCPATAISGLGDPRAGRAGANLLGLMPARRSSAHRAGTSRPLHACPDRHVAPYASTSRQTLHLPWITGGSTSPCSAPRPDQAPTCCVIRPGQFAHPLDIVRHRTA